MLQLFTLLLLLPLANTFFLAPPALVPSVPTHLPALPHIKLPTPAIVQQIAKNSPALTPFAESKALSKVSGLPVFSVCTRWGSPFMIYGPSNRPTALYFLSSEDANSMAQEFLQMPNLPPGQSVHVLCTNFERALRHTTAPENPTGAANDATGTVETMEYRIVSSGVDRYKAKELKEPNAVAAEVPVFAIEGLTDAKGNSLLFMNYDDCISAFKNGAKKGSSAEAPKVEVYDLMSLVKSMEQDTDGAFEKVKFVASTTARDFAKTVSKVGNGNSRLKPMR